MQAFPPMSMYGLAFTQKAAALYGLKSAAQGSGRKRFVIVRTTERTQLLQTAGRERLADMLAAHEGALELLRPGSQAAALSRGMSPFLSTLRGVGLGLRLHMKAREILSHTAFAQDYKVFG